MPNLADLVVGLSFTGVTQFQVALAGVRSSLAQTVQVAQTSFAGMADPRTFDQLVNVTRVLQAELGSVLVPVMRAVAQTLADIATSPTFGMILRGAQEVVGFIVGALQTAVKTVGDFFLGLIADWTAFADVAFDGIDGLKNDLGALLEWIGPKFGAIVSMLGAVFSGLLKTVMTIGLGIKALFQSIATWSSEPLKNLPAEVQAMAAAMDEKAAANRAKFAADEAGKNNSLTRFSTGASGVSFSSLTDAWKRAQTAIGAMSPEAKLLAEQGLTQKAQLRAAEEANKQLVQLNNKPHGLGR